MTMLLRPALVLALALVYAAFFEAAKHLPLFAGSPFAEDPYDAFGSFAFEAAAGLSLLLLLRAAFLLALPDARDRAAALLVRTEVAVVLTVMLGVAPDLVALGRHTEAWRSAPNTVLLAALTAALLATAVGVLGHVLRARPKAQRRPRQVTMAAGTALVTLTALATYPESWIALPMPHLLTIVGALAFFFPTLAAGVTALVPLPVYVADAASPLGRALRRWEMPVVAVLALVAGAAVLATQLREGEGALPDPAKLALVAATYIGVEAAFVLFGYVALRRPLRVLD